METLTIVPFHTDHRQAFLDLNRVWLEELFLMEPYDLQVLSEPEAMVLAKGGQIFFGLLEGQAVATFALTPRGDGAMELNKMAVHKDHQSRGLGHQLMTFAVDHCKALGLVSLELYSHTKLGSAIHLYRKFGFVETPLPEDCVYERANIRMVFRG
tara:strand:+ start:771 stop:1235 length:465 start_codon:yes stop_codon:yes gene_type:complete